MIAVELDHVRKAYTGVLALDDVSMAVPQGEIFGLLGPNGAGKTTSIRMMVGIIVPDSGEVRVFGQQFERRHLRRIGYLPEERGLYRKARIREVLGYLGRLNGLSRGAALERAERWASRLDIREWLDRRVEELSKGMQQKVQLIAALLHDPEFVIMDEPFAGLDPVNTAILMEVLVDLRKSGRTILFSSHRMDHVERLCDRICLLHRGRPVLQGTIPEVKRQFGSRHIRIAFENGGDPLDGTPLIESRTDFGGGIEVRLAPNADTQDLLRYAAGKGRITRFEVSEPSLEEIFIEVIGARDAG